MREWIPRRPAAAWWLRPDREPGPVLWDALWAATAAPSAMNTQPWRFHPDPRGVDVYADRGRQLLVADPSGRELALSVGAALLNLRVAIRAHGRLPAQLLRPSRLVSDLMARVAPGPPAPVPRSVRALAWAIPRRRSNRWPFAPVDLPREVRVALAKAASAEGATLRLLGPAARRDLLDLARVAEDTWREDPAYRHELRLWTEGRTGRRDGVPPAAVGPYVAAGGPALRDLGLAHRIPRRTEATFEPLPTIAVLYAGDTLEQWLRAGQALQRTLLTATVYGVQSTLLTQALEIPRLRELAADPYTGMPAQAVIRLGYGRRRPAASPRRPITEFLLDPASTANTMVHSGSR